jgi:hypothetical protein
MVSDNVLYMLTGLFMTKAIQLWLPINKFPLKRQASIHLFLSFCYLTVGVVGLLTYHGSLPTIILESFVILLTILALFSCVYALATRSFKSL